MANGIVLGFEPATIQAMQEFFSGKLCSECGDDAKRVTYSNIFFCHTCHEKEEPAVETRIVKHPSFENAHIGRRFFTEGEYK